MKLFVKLLWLLLFLAIAAVIAVIVVINPFGASHLNKYQRDGALTLTGLKAPVTVYRDEKGMAYIYARNREDLLMAQGFIAAQDRLFQMELIRLFSSGRISELAGEKAKALDLRMRTLGFHRQAEKHVELLNEKNRLFLQKYVDGVNAFIRTRPGEHHLEFKLAGVKPGLWTIADSLTILYFMGWGSAANLKSEVVAQMLVEKLGPARAAEIFPLNINPDDEPRADYKSGKTASQTAGLGLDIDTITPYLEDFPLQIGSNNWVTAPRFSPSGRPIVANDPHLDARILPGPWYPCGLITPKIRAVGVTIAGMPGMVVGRTSHLAMGVTNAYGDAQDLYVETVDPNDSDRYLEGQESIPFEVIEETLKIRDKDAPGGFRQEKIKVRLTKRGPVISHVLPALKTDKVITARWSSVESMGPAIGFERFLTCRSAAEFRRALKDINQIALNFVFADTQGNIGWQTTGRLPIRASGDGLVPYVVQDGRDNWSGWIPWDKMPRADNPDRGWVGTCNHMTVSRDYPYYYSSHVSPSYRYRRLIELLDAPGKKTAANHWKFQRDAANLMARKIAPVMAQALMAKEDTKKMGRILSSWDFVDHPDKAAPTIFQAVYREFALLVYADELGESLARTMLGNWYFWQERLQDMVLAGDSPWFDNIGTGGKRETRDELFHQAALNAAGQLKPVLGDDPAEWRWGQAHRLEFVSPIRRSGAGKEWLGGGSHPASGSGETICCGIYDFNKPFKVTIAASLRMVADLGDPDKVLAVLPGGVSGRQFDPHTTDQIEPFMNGDKVYWWFSDKAIKEHTRSTLILSPREGEAR